ncbi:hypothetical protein KJA17_00625 [Patescibacteria group bacterium]|nr:hypothetical protein [Patescibacteria group bacterium]
MRLSHRHALTEEELKSTRTVELPSLENCQHYLRNCAAVISGLAQLLTREPLPRPEKIKKYGKEIDENSRDILEFLEKYRVI